MTVSELEARMDSAELNEWFAYLRIQNSPQQEVRTFESPEAHADALDADLFSRAPKVKS